MKLLRFTLGGCAFIGWMCVLELYCDLLMPSHIAKITT